MNILVLSHYFYPAIGGIETLTEMFSHELVNHGHNVRVLTWSVDNTHKQFPFVVVRNPDVNTLFREHNWADVVFENNPSLRLSWPNVFVRRPLVTSLQTWISRTDGTSSAQDWVKVKWLKRAYKVIACSNAIRNVCFPDSVVIPNPYDANTFRRIPGVTKTEDFVFLGRLVSDKGADAAIKALHQIVTDAERNGKFKPTLTIIGEGPERVALETLSNKLGVGKSVLFTGSLRGEELARCLNKYRYLLVPSAWKEPYGIVALEGMACGCIPIVSDGGGLPEAVGSAGLVFKRGEVADLANHMVQLLTDDALCNQLRAAAADHLAKNQSKTVVKQYLDILTEAVVSQKA